MPTLADVSHLREWTSAVFLGACLLALVSVGITVLLDWLAARDARKDSGQVNERADRQRLNALMATRGKEARL